MIIMLLLNKKRKEINSFFQKNKGFTLIELLAVIIILAIIALIAVPQVMKIIGQSKKSAFENSVDGLFKSSDNYISNFMLKNDGSIPEQFEFECNKDGCKLTNESKEKLNGYKLDGLDDLAFKGKSPKSGNIKVTENGKTIYVDSITDGTWCATGTIENLTISTDCKSVEEPTPDEDKIIDTTPPEVAPEFSATATTNSITVTITKEAEDSDSGIYGYQFSKDGGSTWKPAEPQTSQPETEIVYTFYGVASGNYNVNVRAVNNTYKNNRIIDETNKIEGTMQTISTNSLGSVTEANATPSGYAQSKNVLVNFEGSGVYLIQPTVDAVANIDAVLCTSVDAEYSCTDTMITAGNSLTTGENIWYKVESNPTLTYTSNGSLRYKVIDGTNMTEVGSTNIDGIDVDAPDTATFNVTGTTANSITVKASGTDTESGIYGYQFSKNGGSTWLPSAPQTSATYTFSGLTAGTYTIKIRAINGTYTNNGINELNTLESTNSSTQTVYTLSYNANSGTGSIASQTALSEESVTITTSQPTRSGYTFLGWSTSSTATTATYKANQSITLTSDVTLYAVWEKNATPPSISSFTVTSGSVSNYNTTSITLSATATKGTNAISKFEFYNGSTLIKTVTTTSTSATYTFTSLSTESMNFKVIVYDSSGNTATSNVTESCSYNSTSSCYNSTQYQVYKCTPTGRQYAVSQSCSTTTTSIYNCPSSCYYVQDYCYEIAQCGVVSANECNSAFASCQTACDDYLGGC